jgi:outer membrane protein OmpA-like peptidoglycan-associated protein
VGVRRYRLLLGFFSCLVFDPNVEAFSPLIVDNNRINQLTEKRNAVLLGRGKISSVSTDTLGALLFNPSLLTEVDGISSEVNTNSLGKDLIVYQNLWAVGTPYGNFSAGYSLVDPYDNFLRFNQFYDYSLTYSFEVVKGIFTGVGFVSDPFRQSLSAGVTVPLKTNIRIWRRLGIFGIVYGGSVSQIPLLKNTSLDRPVLISHGLQFTFIDLRYFRAENFLELGVSQDFSQRSFHEGLNLIFFNLLYLSWGMYGNDVMKLTTPVYGGGIDIRRGYTSLKMFYGEETNQGLRSQALTISLSLRLSGKPSTVLSPTSSSGYISPQNGDGIQDVVVFRFGTQKELHVNSWKFVIRNKVGETVKEIESRQSEKTPELKIPGELTWNGRDEFNNYVPDDTYYPRLIYITPDYQVYFLNLREVTVDNTPPSVLAVADSDEVREKYDADSSYSVNLEFRNRSVTDFWELKVVSETGVDMIVREYSGADVPDKFSWNLRDASGRKVSGGRYNLVIDARDEARNIMPHIVIPFIVSYLEFKVTLRSPRDAITPNQGYADFRGNAENSQSIKLWRFYVKNGLNEIVYENNGTGQFSQLLRWSFAKSKAKKIEDGFYFAYLSAEYEDDLKSESLPVKIEIDGVPPAAQISHNPNLFSPDGDGIDEYVSFTINHNEKRPMRDWRLEISESGQSKAMKKFSGLGNPPAAFRWDGTSNSGQLVKSLQRYEYKLFLRDHAGNEKNITGGPIDVDFLIFNLGNELRVQTFGIIFDKVQAKMDKAFYAKLDIIILMSRNRLKEFNLVIEGHGDIFGSDELNYDIAGKRAKIVYDYILEKAPELAGRLRYKSYGKERLIHTDLDPQKQHLNRRVEFYFYKRGSDAARNRDETRS